MRDKAPFINPAGCGGNSGMSAAADASARCSPGSGPADNFIGNPLLVSVIFTYTPGAVKPNAHQTAVLSHRVTSTRADIFCLRRAVDQQTAILLLSGIRLIARGKGVATGLSISRISVVGMCLATHLAQRAAPVPVKPASVGRLMPAGIGRKLKSSSSGCRLCSGSQY